MADAFVRIGDPERSAAAEQLEGHLRAGRITPEDFKRRVQRIATCRTVRDLDQVMVGFQSITHTPALADLGGVAAGGTIAMEPTADSTVSEASTVPTGPGWYEVLDPWDKPLGQSPLTLRKARRIGWVLAIGMSVFTAEPLSLLFPSALEAIIIFSPILLMMVLSFWMAPNEQKAYRWVASPQDGKPIPTAPMPGEPADTASTGGMAAPVMPAPEAAIPIAPPIAPVPELPAAQPTPWSVDGPTFPTVGEAQQNPFDEEDPA